MSYMKTDNECKLDMDYSHLEYNSSRYSRSMLDLSKLNRFLVVEWTFTMAAAVELSYYYYY